MATNNTRSPVSPQKRASHWEELMRKFSQSHKEQCKSISMDIPRVQRSLKLFPTGSHYEGTWDVLGMSGFGTYGFPNGVIYKGEFDDGMFHGNGELQYPNGTIIQGKWNKGELTERTLIFADKLEYSECDWKYCQMPDRRLFIERFTIEYENGVQPAGQSYLTAEQPAREVPTGMYDTGDGFYDPKTKIIYKADDMTAIIRSPSVQEQKWIVDNCRTSADEPLGPRVDLYEVWQEPRSSVQASPPMTAGSRVLNTDTELSFDEGNEVDPIFNTLDEDTSETFSSSSSESKRRNFYTFVSFKK